MEFKDFELPKDGNFTDDEVKGLKALGAYIKSQFENIAAGIKSSDAIIAEVKAKFEESGFSGEKLKKLEEALHSQGRDITLLQRAGQTPQGAKSIYDAAKAVFESEGFKTAYKSLRTSGNMRTGEFALKLQSSDVTNEDVTRTVPSTRIYSDAAPKQAFLSLFRRFPVPQDKNRVMYNDASYTDNTGYLEELAENKNKNTASLVGKYRELSKIGSYLPFSAEMAEDYGYFLAWVQSKAIEGIRNKLDTLLWEGDGDDTSHPQHIYGLKTSGVTAFNASTAGLANSVAMPNIADLLLAMKTQAKVQTNEAYTPNVALVNYATEFKLRTLKNTLGDYIVVMQNGSLLVHGMTIVPTSKVGLKEIVVTDSATLQLYDKRDLTVEIERVPETDSYNLWLWYRGQGLVTRPEKKANVYVADMDVALAAIEKPADNGSATE